jgi:hypothetical protein
VRRNRDRLVDLVNGPPDEEPRWHHRSHAGRRHGVPSQVHTVGVTRHRDIQPVVDDDARGGSSGDADHARDERDELRGVDVAFPNLNDVDTGVDGFGSLLDRRSPAAIGDEANRHAGVSRSRLNTTGTRSAMPAAMFTTPRPVTPPRTKSLTSHDASAGQCSTK